MDNRNIRTCIFLIAFFLAVSVASAEVAPPAARWLPDGAVMAVEIQKPGALLDLAVDLKIPEAIAAAPSFRGTLRDLGNMKRLLDPLGTGAGPDWKELLRKLTAGGITYVSYPGENYVILFDAQDSAALDPLVKLAQLMIHPPAGDTKIFYQDFPGGVTAWSFDGKQVFARTNNRLVVSNHGETIKALFEPHQTSLAASPAYRGARKAAGEGAVATAFINMAMLNKYPPVAKTLEGSKDPMGILLTGVVTQSLTKSNWIALSLRIEGRTLSLHAATDGKPDAAGAAAFTLPPDAAHGVLPNLTVPRELASVSLWRDLGKYYSMKDVLFPEKTSGGILIENFMEIFFTGRNLTDEVFAQFHPQVRLVLARQEFDPAIGTPQEQYPAFALVFRVDHPDEFGEVVEEALQKAIGLHNFTSGQKAEPGLIIDKESYNGVNFSYCYYSARNEKDRAHLPARFNARPSLARVGQYIIVSSTDGLAKDLIDAVKKEDGNASTPLPNAHTVLEISNSADIAALLAANRNSMIREDVVKKGLKPEQAEAEFARNQMLLQRLDGAKLRVSGTSEGQQADFELRLK